MGALLPEHVRIGSVSPASIAIVLTWLGGIYTLRRVRSEHRWEVSAPGAQPGRTRRQRRHPAGEPKPAGSARKAIAIFALASLFTLAAGVVLEVSGNTLADRAGINGVIFGATVLAFATALPEVSSGLAAVRVGDHQLAVADIFGGNAFQVSLFLVADLVAGQPVLPFAGDLNAWLAGLGIVLTTVYAWGVIVRREGCTLRLGLDSIIVIVRVCPRDCGPRRCLTRLGRALSWRVFGPIMKGVGLAASPKGPRVISTAVVIARSDQGKKAIAQARRIAASPESRAIVNQAARTAARAGKAAASPESRERIGRRRARSASASADHVSTPARPPAPAGTPSGGGPPRRGFRFHWSWLIFFARPARDQLLARLARDAARLARPDPVQPVLPRPGDARATSSRSPRRARRSRGRSRRPRATRARSPRPGSAPRSPRSPTRRRSHSCSSRRRSSSTPSPHRQRAVVGEPPGRLRPDAPLHRPARSARAARPATAEMLGAFGRSRARRYQPTGARVTFADVAGIDEAKQELTEVVDFLRHPEHYVKLGARIPHGVLLSGPPGTGKTLLARAVAGEADAPFFSLAASEFVEAIVGVGAARVRDLFAQAKEARSGDHLHRRARRDRPLADVRDRRVQRRQRRAGADAQPDPDRDGRLRLLDRRDRDRGDQPPRRARPGAPAARAASTGGSPCSRPTGTAARRSSRSTRARCRSARTSTSGGSPRRRRAWSAPISRTSSTRRRCWPPAAATTQVREADFTDALERIMLGAERKVMMTLDDRRRTAYHEGGHALVGMLTPGADPVRKISIIPRGQALGVTFSAPDADRYNYERHELLAKIKVALGGRAAEELVFGEPSTGAESDIQQLTAIARQMVGRWGMSDDARADHASARGRPGTAAPRGVRGLGAHPGEDRRGSLAHRRGGTQGGARPPCNT